MLVKVRHDLLEVGFVKVPGDDEGSVRMFVVISAELIMEFWQSQASVCLWWHVNGSNDDRCKLPGQIEWAADTGEMFQMRRAGTRQNGDIPGVTPFLVNHETYSTTFGFSGLGCSVHPQNRKVIRRRYSGVRDRRREPCFSQTKDVTVPNVPLETYTGSKIVHLILQGLDISEQYTR